jgi:hypothetical protein
MLRLVEVRVEKTISNQPSSVLSIDAKADPSLGLRMAAGLLPRVLHFCAVILS